MYSVFNTDRYVIRKNYHLVDLQTLIDSVLQSNNPAEAGQILQQAPHPLEHDEITGVEADAAKYAYDHGLAPDEIRRAFHDGPQNPLYDKAFRHLAEQGAPHINKAIEFTNKMKGSYLPLAFDAEGRVTQQWRNGGAETRDLDEKVPLFDASGKLVTQIRSSYTGEPEAFSRPYHEGLDMLRRQQGIKVKTGDSIKPSLVHRNTVNIQDGKMLSRFFHTIKQGVAADPNADPYQLAHDALKQDSRFPVHSGLQHSEYSEIPRYSQEGLQQTPEQPPREGMDKWLGETADAKWMKYLSSNNYYKQGGAKQQIKDMVAHHGMSEEEAKQFFSNVHSNASGRDGAYVKRFKEDLQEWHMRDGVPPDWINSENIPQGQPLSGNGPQAPSEEQPVQETPPQPLPQAPVIPTVPHPPQNPIPPKPEHNKPFVSAPPALGTPLPPPPPSHTTPPSPPLPPSNTTPYQPPQNQNSYPSDPPPKQQGRIGAMLNNFIERLGYGYESVFPGLNKSDLSEVEKVREVLEFVQIEIAKSEGIDSTKPLSIHSHSDVSMFAASMRRPSSDIITVFESRGDWRNLAKSWGMEHSEIQKIKVMFE